ncbi:MAG: IS21-like element helper ATPase IstB [Kiritimatiellae bacterium]|nr:IS21-like element helper ATPase IstB [Kiritimatiellia bacterium]
MSNNLNQILSENLKELHLPTVRSCYEELARQAEKNSLSYEKYLLELAQQEIIERRNRKVQRFLKESRLPLEKTMDSYDLKILPRKIALQVKTLLDTSFLDRKENVLAFGNPGSGKTHLLCAICHELIKQQRRVYFSTCSMLVQQLLLAKRELALAKLIKKLSRYDVIFIDDIGYVQQDKNEMEVLFTLLAERYERGSVMITSNLPFSKWEKIFKDPLTTAAAIDKHLYLMIYFHQRQSL